MIYYDYPLGVENNIQLPVDSNVNVVMTEWLLNQFRNDIDTCKIGFYPIKILVSMHLNSNLEYHGSIKLLGEENYGVTVVTLPIG